MEMEVYKPRQQGAAPEQGASFLNEQKLTRGLTYAETIQLTFDYEADPTLFELIVRFRNRYIDELEDLESKLKTYKISQAEHRKRQQSYGYLNDWASKPNDVNEAIERVRDKLFGPDEVTKIALRAAGVHVLHSNDILSQQHDDFSAAAGQLTASMTKYFGDRVSSLAPIIYGRTYGFVNGVLTSVKREDKKDRVTFFEASQVSGTYFAIGKASRAFISENYTGSNADCGALKPGNRYVKIADITDWQRLIDGLNLMAKF